MFIKKLALFSTATLFCAGLAFAQAPDAQQHPEHHKPDFAAMHKSMCEDRAAHAAAKLAFVEAKLSLTDAQKPLFAKWRQAVLDAEGKQKTTCLAEPAPAPDSHPTVLDHEQRAEAKLTAELQLLQSTRPSLQAFYNSLTDAQKDSFNRMHEEHMHGHDGMEHGPMMGGHDGGPDSMHHPQ
jgi:hypothetical protein